MKDEDEEERGPLLRSLDDAWKASSKLMLDDGMGKTDETKMRATRYILVLVSRSPSRVHRLWVAGQMWTHDAPAQLTLKEWWLGHGIPGRARSRRRRRT